jgi:hypothetical protein
MFDYDPRDQDARERDDGIRDREEAWLVTGRGPGSTSVRGDVGDGRSRDGHRTLRDERSDEAPDREHDRGSVDPREVFSRELDLPRGREREWVRDVGDYRLNNSDVRTLSTVGAFRVVAERDLRDGDARFEVRDRDLNHLVKQGLIERVPLSGRERAVTLTDRGRSLLEAHRDRQAEGPQRFYSGADRPRERTHDVQVYRAYLDAAERLREKGARILRVELDRELKREYQRFLHERQKGDRDSDGRPDRSRAEIEDWAREHELPHYDDQVHFPDLRIEYESADGDVRFEDVEVTTEHYRGRHGSSAARSGFSVYASRRGGGAAFDPHVAEDFL